MRVPITLVLAAPLVALLAACSSAPSSILDHRSSAGTGEDATEPAPARKDAPQAQPSGNGEAPPDTPPPATPAPPPSSSSSAKPPDAGAPPPAPAGSCGNPKCIAGGGLCGCKATDAAGDVVTMGCQDGECGCFAGGQATATFEGTCDTTDDAVSLFVTNCGCN